MISICIIIIIPIITIMNQRNRRFTNSIDDDIHVEKGLNGVETYVFDPFNPINKEITENEIKTILNNYGINLPINNFNLYRRAFVHRSYVKHTETENLQNNVTIVSKPPDCLPLYGKSNECFCY